MNNGETFIWNCQIGTCGGNPSVMTITSNTYHPTMKEHEPMYDFLCAMGIFLCFAVSISVVSAVIVGIAEAHSRCKKLEDRMTKITNDDVSDEHIKSVRSVVNGTDDAVRNVIRVIRKV